MAVFSALAMIGVFVSPILFLEYGTTSILMRFVQFEALAVALSIISALAVPNYLGVMKGEKVLVITSDPLKRSTTIKIATALEGGKINSDIKIEVGNSVLTGTIESYCGIITPARISIKPEKNINVI